MKKRSMMMTSFPQGGTGLMTLRQLALDRTK
jgi:hypothetical protein